MPEQREGKSTKSSPARRPIPMSKIYVEKITFEQAEKLRDILFSQNWDIDQIQYAYWRARKEKTTATAYHSGKLTVQGKGTADLVQFTIEPQITGVAKYGYETELAKEEISQDFIPHIGIDESGKGDYFGPLCTAAAYVDHESYPLLVDAGVQDSKNIKSDKKIKETAQKIRKIIKGNFSIIAIGNEKYNSLYEKIKNLNKLLAWTHAQSLENVLEKVPDCTYALSDQFAKSKSVVQDALMERGQKIELRQQTKAESDIAVAAASILARDEFVRRMEEMAVKLEMPKIPKGASPQVKAAAREIYKKHGYDGLKQNAKLHFKTTLEIING